MTGLSVRGIRKSFGGVEVLHGVDLDAEPGSIVALLGENGAGKSTLVRIIAGDYQSDAGEITIDDQSFTTLSLTTAQSAGVRMIHQEFPDAPTLSVAENVLLGRLPSRAGVVDWAQARAQATAVLDEIGMALDPKRMVGTLSIGERQVIEIAKALSGHASVLILDEPTAALSQHEVDRLFELLQRLRERGVAIIYITHRLDEVKEIADRVVVLRDGVVAAEGEVDDFERQALVAAMLGHAAGEVTRPARRTWQLGADPVLELHDASSEAGFEDVSLDVRPGEVVALYGKLGSGSSAVAECVFGLRRLDAGTLLVNGRHGSTDPAKSIAHGVGFVPADRKGEAILPIRPVAENVAVSSWSRLSRFGLMSRGREAQIYERWRDELSIKGRNDPLQEIATLSGGNQQKVVLARWLERGTPLLIMVEPTRGVDVGARADIYTSLRKLVEKGVGILISTSDQEEVVQVADRAIVMARGRIVAELEDDLITTNRLLTETVAI